MNSISRGLILAHQKKSTENKAIVEAAAPSRVVLPLLQSLGCPADPFVGVGDLVTEGQKIADSSKFIFAPLHAPISGKITQIERLANACGFAGNSIVIEGGGGSGDPVIRGSGDRGIRDYSPEQIRQIVKEAGIVGLGGAVFPTHVKLTPPAGKVIDTILINGCECEPCITADYRLMVEQAEQIIAGSKLICKAVGAKRIVFGVEDNKPEAIASLRKAENGIEIAVLKSKYPQGGEKQLIKAILGKEVPSSGLPHDIGVLVNNVGTAAAVADAVYNSRPLTKRVITVTGSLVQEPRNLLVRIGTSFKELIEQCGGLTEEPAKIIMGGPMMGLAVGSLDIPVVKATTCILVLSKAEAKVYEERHCIRCGRCIKACPIGLTPNFIADAAKLNKWEKTGQFNVADCIECGCCSYVCPSRINLVQYFKLAKKELLARKAVCK